MLGNVDIEVTLFSTSLVFIFIAHQGFFFSLLFSTHYKNDHLTLKMASTILGCETSVANNSPSQSSNPCDDHFQSRTIIIINLEKIITYLLIIIYIIIIIIIYINIDTITSSTWLACWSPVLTSSTLENLFWNLNKNKVYNTKEEKTKHNIDIVWELYKFIIIIIFFFFYYDNMVMLCNQVYRYAPFIYKDFFLE